MTVAAADPGSCSRLGGALCTAAARLTSCSGDLDPDGPPPLASQVAALLQNGGSRLQMHAQELAELAANAERLRTRVAAAGLQLRGFRVLEPPGVVQLSDAERRIGAHSQLQASADLVAARLGRARADLVRSLDRAAAGLGQLVAEKD